MDENESLSYSKWECKYHVVFIRSAVAERCIGRCASIWARVSKPERKPNTGRAFDAGSCAYVDIDPAEIRGIEGSWLHQRDGGRFTWLVFMVKRNGTLSVNISGHEGILFRRWDETMIWEYIRHQEQEDQRSDK